MKRNRLPRLTALCALMVVSSLACGPTHHRIGSASRSVRSATQRIEDKVDRLITGQEITHDLLDELLGLARKQGSGEITLFFGAGNGNLRPGSDEHRRLVRFLDQLAVQSSGRKIVLVCVGSASAPGWLKLNQRLSQRRAQTTAAEIERYLVNHPHKVKKATGSGARNSPVKAGWRINRRYQSVRVIAVFEPALSDASRTPDQSWDESAPVESAAAPPSPTGRVIALTAPRSPPTG